MASEQARAQAQAAGHPTYAELLEMTAKLRSLLAHAATQLRRVQPLEEENARLKEEIAELRKGRRRKKQSSKQQQQQPQQPQGVQEPQPPKKLPVQQQQQPQEEEEKDEEEKEMKMLLRQYRKQQQQQQQQHHTEEEEEEEEEEQEETEESAEGEGHEPGRAGEHGSDSEQEREREQTRHIGSDDEGGSNQDHAAQVEEEVQNSKGEDAGRSKEEAMQGLLRQLLAREDTAHRPSGAETQVWATAVSSLMNLKEDRVRGSWEHVVSGEEQRETRSLKGARGQSLQLAETLVSILTRLADGLASQHGDELSPLLGELRSDSPALAPCAQEKGSLWRGLLVCVSAMPAAQTKDCLLRLDDIANETLLILEQEVAPNDSPRIVIPFTFRCMRVAILSGFLLLMYAVADESPRELQRATIRRLCVACAPTCCCTSSRAATALANEENAHSRPDAAKEFTQAKGLLCVVLDCAKCFAPQAIPPLESVPSGNGGTTVMEEQRQGREHNRPTTPATTAATATEAVLHVLETNGHEQQDQADATLVQQLVNACCGRSPVLAWRQGDDAHPPPESAAELDEVLDGIRLATQVCGEPVGHALLQAAAGWTRDSWEADVNQGLLKLHEESGANECRGLIAKLRVLQTVLCAVTLRDPLSDWAWMAGRSLVRFLDQAVNATVMASVDGAELSAALALALLDGVCIPVLTFREPVLAAVDRLMGMDAEIVAGLCESDALCTVLCAVQRLRQTPLAYVINLDRRRDRYAACLAEARWAGFLVERLSAVDGSAPAFRWPDGAVAKRWNSTHNSRYDRHTTPNEAVELTQTECANAFSHLCVWRAFAAGRIRSSWQWWWPKAKTKEGTGRPAAKRRRCSQSSSSSSSSSSFSATAATSASGESTAVSAPDIPQGAQALDSILVLEDDAVLKPQFRNHVLSALLEVPSTFDLLNVGYIIPRECRARSASFVFQAGWFWCMHAYVLSRAGVTKLTAEINLPVCGPLSIHVSHKMDQGKLQVFFGQVAAVQRRMLSTKTSTTRVRKGSRRGRRAAPPPQPSSALADVMHSGRDTMDLRRLAGQTGTGA